MQRQGFCQNRILGAVCQPLFGVPPVEKRPILKYPLLRNLIFCYYDRNSTEAYLYLKICLLNLFLNLPLIALFWFSYLQHAEIDIGFLHIVPDPVRPVDVFIHEYPKQVFPILIGIMLAYSLLLFPRIPI